MASAAPSAAPAAAGLSRGVKQRRESETEPGEVWGKIKHLVL